MRTTSLPGQHQSRDLTTLPLPLPLHLSLPLTFDSQDNVWRNQTGEQYGPTIAAALVPMQEQLSDSKPHLPQVGLVENITSGYIHSLPPATPPPPVLARLPPVAKSGTFLGAKSGTFLPTSQGLEVDLAARLQMELISTLVRAGTRQQLRKVVLAVTGSEGTGSLHRENLRVMFKKRMNLDPLEEVLNVILDGKQT
jgi:hypothetical protein